ncbi:MAG: histidinol-phosphate transaminase [Alphaproteobacteria bacterium]
MTISPKTHRAPSPRSGVMEIAAYVPGSHKVAGIGKVHVLSANESALGPSSKAVEAVRQVAAHLHQYPDGSATELRVALGKRWGLDPARIVCGAGSDELISLITHTYAGPGDEVLYSQYGFLMYPIAARASGATPVAVPERHLTVDVAAVLAHVTDRTRILFLANPNNPTGSYLSSETMRNLRERLRSDILLVIDAAYAEYVGANDYTSGVELVDAGENVVMTRTFSKIFGLASLRLGWAYCPTRIADALNRVRGPFNVSAAAQAAGIAALEDVAQMDAAKAYNDKWRSWLEKNLQSLGLEVKPSVGNFLLTKFPSTAEKNATVAAEFLAKKGILVRPMRAYGLGDYLRITIGDEPALKALVEALTDFCR